MVRTGTFMIWGSALQCLCAKSSHLFALSLRSCSARLEQRALQGGTGGLSMGCVGNGW